MKTLLLMRHADPDNNNNFSDKERPLTDVGQRDARQVGAILRKKDLVPQVILCSNALRASQTARLVADGAGLSDLPTILDTLYMAEPEVYIKIISTLSEEYKQVLVVGHNPELGNLVQNLTGKKKELSTGTLVIVSLPFESWNSLEFDRKGKLIELITPSRL